MQVFLWVIPEKAGIQRLLRGPRLDPGSALRAVRDDRAGSALRAVQDDKAGSTLRAVRDDIRKQVRGVQDDGAGSTLRVVHEDARKYARRCPFAVIPAKAGIQWLLRGVRLDPGSTLRAVRDDGAGSALRAVRDDNREKERVGRNDIRKQVRGVQDDGAGSTLRVVHEDARKYARHCPFAVIPAKAGIQWLLRGACLEAGSALRAVRDDGAGAALHAVLEEGVQECVRRGEVCMVVARGADQPSSASSRARSSSRRKSPAAPGDTRAARLASGVRPTPACPAASAALR